MRLLWPLTITMHLLWPLSQQGCMALRLPQRTGVEEGLTGSNQLPNLAFWLLFPWVFGFPVCRVRIPEKPKMWLLQVWAPKCFQKGLNFWAPVRASRIQGRLFIEQLPCADTEGGSVCLLWTLTKRPVGQELAPIVLGRILTLRPSAKNTKLAELEIQCLPPKCLLFSLLHSLPCVFIHSVLQTCI